MTYIKRKDLLDEARKTDLFFELENLICEAPCEDVYKVIHCKDCKYHKPYMHDPGLFHCDKIGIYNRSFKEDGDFWCGYAKPLESGNRIVIKEYVDLEEFKLFFDKKMEGAPLPKKTIENIKDQWTKNIPTVTASEARYGEWKEELAGNGWNDWANYTCSNCGTKFEKWHKSKFCPECGAIMYKELEE